MPLFENQKCPVCSREFEKNDDVVFCPECGTPHHRECYNFVGHCVNEGLHQSNYSYFDEHNKAEKNSGQTFRIPQPPTDSYYSPGENKSGEIKSNNGNISSEPQMTPFGPIPNFATAFDNDKEQIDGESVSDFAAAIKTNIPRFISIFKKQKNSKKKTSWNWGAFVFGSFYFFFRKMYRQGITLLALFGAILFGSNALYLKFAPNFTSAMQDFYSLAINGNTDAAMQKYQSMQNISDAKNAMIISYSILALIIVVRVFEALFADRIYKTTVSSLIKKVRSQIEDGAMFQVSMMMESSEINLSQDQMKRLYLARRGGVNVFAPIIAFLAFRIIIILIQSF